MGRVSPEKGVGLFAEAARRIGAAPVIIGDGPSVEEIRRRYPEARLLGWQSPDEVRQHLHRARALVFPSVWYEGQPLTVYEALALGTPVIVSDVCAGREGVVHGETGLWFRSGDPASLAEALRALSDSSVARRMGEAAHRRYWANPMTLERHVDGLLAVYGEALGARAAPARGVPGPATLPASA